MRNWFKSWTGKPQDQGGPYAMACERLWRATEDLAVRQDSLGPFLNAYVQDKFYSIWLPPDADVPNSCRGLLSSVKDKLASKRTLKTVEVDGYEVPTYSFEDLTDDEARNIAKAIVDLTYAITIENAVMMGRSRRH